MSSKGGDKKTEVKKVETKKEEAKPAPTDGGSLMDDLSKKQAFKKFSYRGEDITKLIGMSMDDLA